MAEIPDAATLDQLVTRVADQAGARLKATAADAKERSASLSTASKSAGNRLRSNDIKASLAAESTLALDAHALARRLGQVKRSMRADLDRLVAAAQGGDGSG